MKTEYHILNLGAGVQSTRLYEMFRLGEITPQEESADVYRHLEWLQSLNVSVLRYWSVVA